MNQCRRLATFGADVYRCERDEGHKPPCMIAVDGKVVDMHGRGETHILEMTHGKTDNAATASAAQV